MAEETIRRIRNLPHLGQRIIKTSIAVFLCLVIYHMRGYRSGSMPVESAITAIVCMQPVVSTAGEFALNRFKATTIGAFWGILFVVCMDFLPAAVSGTLIVYVFMSLGVLLSLYSAVLLHRPDMSSLCAIIFLCIAISYPNIEDPLRDALLRIVDIMIGTAVAVCVNIFRLPRDHRRERVFFLYQRDLIPSSSATLTPALQFQLNNLYRDGARICIQSEHAPAFFAMQFHSVNLALPLIVMDGAAIFDTNENRYLWAEYILPLDYERLSRALNDAGEPYFIYTLHRDRICIFHRGEMQDEEKLVYERMRRSPYRIYLEGEVYDPKEIVSVKLIFRKAKRDEISALLEPVLAESQMRMVIRPQEGAEDLLAVYLYNDLATLAHARERIMEYLGKDEPGLIPQIITLEGGCRDERDTRELLRRVEKSYEPVRLPILSDRPE